MGPIEQGGSAVEAQESPESRRESSRRRAWAAGGFVLLALSGLLVATGVVGLVTGGAEVAFLALSLPPAGTGLLVRRRVASVRVSAVSVALAYGAFALYVATSPLRGLTPAEGAPSPGPDLALIVVGAAFGLAAALVLVGSPER
jgi:hypothetical protein